MGPRGAGSGRVGRLGLSGVGEDLIALDEAEWGRVGPVRAEWGWGGVGHALGFN